MSDTLLSRILRMHDETSLTRAIVCADSDTGVVFESSDLLSFQTILDETSELLELNGDSLRRSELAADIIKLAKSGTREPGAIKAMILKRHAR